MSIVFRKMARAAIILSLLAALVRGAIPTPLYASSWWDPDWHHKNVFSFKASTISEDLAWFTVLVVLTPDRVDYSKMQADGDDIRFVDDDDATPLDFEREGAFVPGGTNYYWVEVPQVDKEEDYTDYIYIYYDNPDAVDGQNVAGTWDENGANNYKVVQHFNEASGTLYDSTSNNNDGVPAGAITYEAAGKIGYAMAFDGASGVVTIANSATWNAMTNYTVELWGYTAVGYAPDQTRECFIDACDNYESLGIGLFWVAGNTMGWATENTTADLTGLNVQSPGGVWTNYDIVASGASAQAYRQGNAVSTPKNSAQLTIAVNFLLAYNHKRASYLGCSIDELRVSAVARSDEWLEATYLTETDTFLYYGSEDPPPTMSTQAAIGITMDKDGITGGTFNGTLEGLGGAPSVDVWFEYGLTDGYGSETDHVEKTETGAFTDDVPEDLTPGETYHYRAVGENVDGQGYGEDQEFTFTMPTVTTNAATDVTWNRAILNGDLSDLGVATGSYLYFEYGPTIAYGNTTPVGNKAEIGTYDATVQGMIVDTTYHFRSVARIGNSSVYAYGADQTFYVPFRPDIFTGTTPILLVIPLLIFACFVWAALQLIMFGLRVYREGTVVEGLMYWGISFIIISVGVIAFTVLIQAVSTILGG